MLLHYSQLWREPRESPRAKPEAWKDLDSTLGATQCLRPSGRLLEQPSHSVPVTVV